ncbi:hypothetical protein ACFQH9_03920 [Pseudonocardia lutea]|uniref:Small secreted hydrophilic protein n=1 Tax=Pseudonocardia lutea TaxID=2172015 RepID=A0ABW1I3W3_9PSEU
MSTKDRVGAALAIAAAVAGLVLVFTGPGAGNERPGSPPPTGQVAPRPGGQVQPAPAQERPAPAQDQQDDDGDDGND